MGVIRFNGISSAEFGCTIERRPNHTRGSRRGELIEIPGRNGAIVLEDGSYSTYVQQYVVAFEEGDTMPPYKRAEQVAAWLLGSHGFCRLEDDFEPDVYRMARYAGPLNIEQVASEYGRCVIEFECQPQRYLKIGEMQINFEHIRLLSDSIECYSKLYGVPDNVSKVVFASTSQHSYIKLENPDTGTESRRDGVFQSDGEWTSYYLSELNVEEGYTTLTATTGGLGGTIPVGTNLLFFEGENGDRTQILEFNESDFILINPTQNEARPLMRFAVHGEQGNPPPSNTVATINGTTVTIDFPDGEDVWLDCDLHDAYLLGGANANSLVTFTSETDAYPTFPSFGGGRQYIEAENDGRTSDIEITPRWWAL